ncbi:hypothetical protein SAMN05444351_0260 [Geodermatophilus nigrescens]|uniref:Uncharacterized protein n=1 Tax=Geodermatophilus nigrescens TaxID=1070870 RepID=A0A1M5D8B3_9ACTN|nr:hypothetical protein SAMN05444351_0260 [Geodermatophilus nigrescens]
MPVGTLPRHRPRHAPRPVTATGLALLFSVAGLLAGGVVLAAPAAAVDDPARPDARVTHGPSCRPGGVVVEVTAGTVAYAVTLATTRRPAGEDSAEVAAGETVVLRTGDVAWGEVVDSRLEYTALDDSGTAYTDELDGFVFTRPSEEDCAAIAAPPGAGDVPPASPAPPATAAPSSPGEPTPGEGPAEEPGTPSAPAGAAPDALPVPGLPEPAPGSPVDGGVSPGGAVVASSALVAAGDAVTLTGAGFTPGEVVRVRLADGTELTAVPAGPDGQVLATVRIPGGAAAGATTLALVGAESETVAEVQLRVAAAAAPVDRDPVPVPLVAAGLALVVTATGLVLVAAGRRERTVPSGPPGSA